MEDAVQNVFGVLFPDEYDFGFCIRIETDVFAEAIFDSGRCASDRAAGDLGGGRSFHRYAEDAV